MYLHEDRAAFQLVIQDAVSHFKKKASIIEKDYYITMILKLLAENLDDCVFKGGTSLSKGFHVLNRFSEDVDITFTGHLGESRRKNLKNVVLRDISQKLHMPISNWEKTRSKRDYNCYVFEYIPLNRDDVDNILPDVRLETALGSSAFPTETREIDSYVGSYLREKNLALYERYALEPFQMCLQSLERTYIDKVFALCDYYLQRKSIRYARHLYDIFQLTSLIKFDEAFKKLIGDVREHRAKMKICPSAVSDVDVSKLLLEVCDSNFFMEDYGKLTPLFIEAPVAYEDAVRQLRTLAVSGWF